MNGEDNFFLAVLFNLHLPIFKAKKCLDTLLEGAYLIMLLFVHSPLLNTSIAIIFLCTYTWLSPNVKAHRKYAKIFQFALSSFKIHMEWEYVYEKNFVE